MHAQLLFTRLLKDMGTFDGSYNEVLDNLELLASHLRLSEDAAGMMSACGPLPRVFSDMALQGNLRNLLVTGSQE